MPDVEKSPAMESVERYSGWRELAARPITKDKPNCCDQASFREPTSQPFIEPLKPHYDGLRLEDSSGGWDHVHSAKVLSSTSCRELVPAEDLDTSAVVV